MDQQIRKRHLAKRAMMIMAVVVAGAALTPVIPFLPTVELVTAALLGVIAMVLTHCIKVTDLVPSLDLQVLFLLIGTIPLGHAMVATGLNEDLAAVLLESVGRGNPYILIATLYLFTNILTALISNTAVAVLMTPLAIGLAHQTGLDPKPLVMTIAYAASAAFITPFSYQTNIIVMGPGGYLFKDYFRVGMPLTIMLWLAASFFIPWWWPMNPQ